MKRLLIAAGVAGLCLSAAAQASDRFQIRYRVQYSGGAYLGYPSTTKYSVSYYPQIGANGGGTADASGNPVYPRYLGNGYTVNAYPGPYTSYGYKFAQTYTYPSNGGAYGGGAYGGGAGCNSCDSAGVFYSGAGGNNQGPMTHTYLRSGGQTSRTVTPGVPGQSYGAPVQTYEGAPVQTSPQGEGVTVPGPVAPKVPEAQPQGTKIVPKTARGSVPGVPKLVSDVQTIEN